MNDGTFYFRFCNQGATTASAGGFQGYQMGEMQAVSLGRHICQNAFRIGEAVWLSEKRERTLQRVERNGIDEMDRGDTVEIGRN